MLKKNRLTEAIAIGETMALNTVFDDEMLKTALYKLAELTKKVTDEGEDSVTAIEVSAAIGNLYNADPEYMNDHFPQIHSLIDEATKRPN